MSQVVKTIRIADGIITLKAANKYNPLTWVKLSALILRFITLSQENRTNVLTLVELDAKKKLQSF